MFNATVATVVLMNSRWKIFLSQSLAHWWYSGKIICSESYVRNAL